MITGRCGCGHCKWQAAGPIHWGLLCHCQDCRHASSSDYVSWLCVERSTVKWSGQRSTYQSSEEAERSFCANCGSPLSFESDLAPDETHLYAATLDDPSWYKPQAHIFWSERLPWVNVREDLPKNKFQLEAER